MRLFLILLCFQTVSVFAQKRYQFCEDYSCLIIPRLSDDEGLLEVYRVQDGVPSIFPISGKMTVLEEELVFYARVPLNINLEFEVRVIGNKGIRSVVVAPIPNQTETPAFVKAIYPTSNILPMNQLKLYVEFDKPVWENNIYNQIRLYNLNTKEEEKEAFIQMGEELWDQDHKRLTLFFDPGRIKRGVGPHEQLGLPLRSGHEYQLEIGPTGPQTKFVKQFKVITADRNKPDIDSWQFKIPQAGTTQPLQIDFPEPMDYGLLKRFIKVIDTNGRQITGHITLENEERRWLFTPDSDWDSVDYHIKVNSWLEDLAGNNLSRLFDIDLQIEAERAEEYDVRSISFSPIPIENLSTLNKK